MSPQCSFWATSIVATSQNCRPAWSRLDSHRGVIPDSPPRRRSSLYPSHSSVAAARCRRIGTALDIHDAPVYHTPYPIGGKSTVSHTKSEKVKLLNRVRRVRGQIEAGGRARGEAKGGANVVRLNVAGGRARR